MIYVKKSKTITKNIYHCVTNCEKNCNFAYYYVKISMFHRKLMKEIYCKLTTKIVRHVFMACLLLSSLSANAHSVMDDGHYIDTLSLAERISLHTNAVDWVIGVPNLGVEFDLKGRNYNRWTVMASMRWRPSMSNTFVMPVVFNIFEASLEGRAYWRERRATATGIFHHHRMWYEKILSARSMLPSHPTWVFYRGGYAAYTKYSFLIKDFLKGRQGTAIQAGFTWGFEMPLYQFSDGNSLDLDCGVSGGLCLRKEDKYEVDEYNNAYGFTEKDDKWKLCHYPVLKDIHVSFVYRFGHYPIQKRYRWRYDADIAYRNVMDSLYSDAEARALQQYIADSIYKIVYTDFRHVYDSVLAVRMAEEKMAQIEQTRKDIETLKAEAEQQGEELFEVEPGKSKKNKKEKKSKKKEKAEVANDEQSEEQQPAEQQVDDGSATEQEQEQALLNSLRKEDNDEV